MLCNQIIGFNSQLKITTQLPKGIIVLNPFKDVTTARLIEICKKKLNLS
ncbi:MAG: hypothetical protein ACKO96_33905 [Flammeovirgaceae bacterium]